MNRSSMSYDTSRGSEENVQMEREKNTKKPDS